MFATQLFDALAAADVRYCVVGGVAVNLHGIPRMTYDIDIMVEMSATNLTACAAAMKTLGLMSRLPIRLEDAADASTATAWEDERNLIAATFVDPANPLREVDVLIAPSLDPSGVVARATAVAGGIYVATIPDLIRLKERAGRRQDLADIAHLKRLLP